MVEIENEKNSDFSDLNRNKSTKIKKKKLFIEIIEWILIIIAAIVLSVIIKDFFYEHYKVDQTSMHSTLYEGESLIVSKFNYRFSDPARRDIVVLEHQSGKLKGLAKILLPFPNPGEIDYVKRIIGLPGEKIDIHDGKVYINNKALDESYIIPNSEPGNFNLPVVIPKDKYFVLGDNRPESRDSRDFGFIDRTQIKGKVVLRIWPLSKFGTIEK